MQRQSYLSLIIFLNLKMIRLVNGPLTRELTKISMMINWKVTPLTLNLGNIFSKEQLRLNLSRIRTKEKKPTNHQKKAIMLKIVLMLTLSQSERLTHKSGQFIHKTQNQSTQSKRIVKRNLVDFFLTPLKEPLKEGQIRKPGDQQQRSGSYDQTRKLVSHNY